MPDTEQPKKRTLILKHTDQAPSDRFTELVHSGGTPVADCDLCGRTHYTGSGQYMEEGELDKLRAATAADPEHYVETSDDSVSIGQIDGRQSVWGCPCNGLTRYESFIWHHRHLIVDYLEARANAAALAAGEDAALVRRAIPIRKLRMDSPV